MTRTLYDLYGRDERLRFSPYCWRVRMALAHKGLDVTLKPWRFSQKEALAFAHHDQVPVLCDGDKVVTDSFEIMRYLDDAYPEAPVLGEDVSYQRALFFKHFVERSVAPSLFRIVVLDLLAAIHPGDRDYFRETREARFGCTLEEFHQPEQGRAALQKTLAPVRGVLRETPFLDGEIPSGADYLLFGSMMWAYCVSKETLVPPDDEVAHWFERMLAQHNGLAANAFTVRDLPAE
ncbi:glutathione S-transferase family protein [Halomonas alkaliantarctica]|nr:glutathione S-transferase family protein [Halomonas alkaliantarctica]